MNMGVAASCFSMIETASCVKEYPLYVPFSPDVGAHRPSK